jgi:hypothetical protein
MYKDETDENGQSLIFDIKDKIQAQISYILLIILIKGRPKTSRDNKQR